MAARKGGAVKSRSAKARSEAAKRGWETRRKREAARQRELERRRRSEAAKRGWEARRKREAARQRELERRRRSEAAKRGWEKRRQREAEEKKKRPPVPAAPSLEDWLEAYENWGFWFTDEDEWEEQEWEGTASYEENH